MAPARFAWDERKDRANRKKHGVSFDEAQTVFLDDNARLLSDPGHSGEENRFVLLGMSARALHLGRLPLLSRAGRGDKDHLGSQGNEERTGTIRRVSAMRKEYDFSKSRKNPYAKMLKKQITIRLDVAVIEHFKKLAAETGIPYQNLINLYLKDCASSDRKLLPQVGIVRPRFFGKRAARRKKRQQIASGIDSTVAGLAPFSQS